MHFNSNILESICKDWIETWSQLWRMQKGVHNDNAVKGMYENSKQR